MTKPLVSVMIPTYNRPALFELTLRSALAQDYEPLEIIVCDNSANDETEALIQKYLGDGRLSYHRNREAKTKAENFMPFEHLAKGEYLQWLMDDDIILPEKISLMMKCFADNPQVTLVTSQRAVIDGNGEVIGWFDAPFPIKQPYSIYPAEFIAWLTLREAQNFLGEPSALLFRRRDLTHHYWRADIKGLVTISDIAMGLELLEKGSCAIFFAPLSYYRRHGEQEGQQTDVIINSRLEWNTLNEEYFNRQVFPYKQEDYCFFLQCMVDEYKKFVALAKPTASAAKWQEYEHFIGAAQAVIRTCSKKGE